MEYENIDQKVRDIKQSLKDSIKKFTETIKKLPDNNNTKRINKNCFIIKVSEINKHDSWSPEYHDFKYQYKAILKRFAKQTSLNFVKNLSLALEAGWIKMTDQHILKLHPEVIKRVLEIMYGSPDVITSFAGAKLFVAVKEFPEETLKIILKKLAKIYGNLEKAKEILNHSMYECPTEQLRIKLEDFFNIKRTDWEKFYFPPINPTLNRCESEGLEVLRNDKIKKGSKSVSHARFLGIETENYINILNGTIPNPEDIAKIKNKLKITIERWYIESSKTRDEYFSPRIYRAGNKGIKEIS